VVEKVTDDDEGQGQGEEKILAVKKRGSNLGSIKAGIRPNVGAMSEISGETHKPFRG